MKKILLFAVSFLIVVSFNSALGDEWWNESWHFRVPVDVNSSIERENVSVTVDINFTQILENNSVQGTFDSNSIRVVESNYSSPYDWNTSLNAGNLTWVANGTVNSTNRRFWIYFDILGNGAKSKGNLMKDTPHWRSGYDNNMNVWSNQSASPGVGYAWNRTWAKSLEVYWKWSTESGYDFAYLYVDGTEVKKNSGSGSGNATFVGRSIEARFTSDEGTTSPTTDEYGTYGTAVDWIKFYPTTNVTKVPVNKSLGNLDKQNLRINLIEPPNGSIQYYGDNITLEANVTDVFGSPMENVSVNFTVIYNNTVSYLCNANEEGAGYYNCSWNSEGKNLGNYSVMVNASKQYYDSNTTTWANRFTLDKRHLRVNLIEPQDNSTHYRGEDILLRVNITDQDNNLVSGVSVNFTVKYNDTLFYNLTGIDEGNGYYNCSWNSTDKQLGNYSIEVNASKQYYYSNSTLWIDRFNLETGPPVVNMILSSREADQLSWIQINATVEDQSGYGIDWTKINITQPNGFVESKNMTNVSGIWTFNYTNTSQRGIYDVTVYAKDKSPYEKIGSSEDNFTIHVKLNVTLSTNSNIYYRDESARISYKLKDLSGEYLSGANVTLKIKNPEGQLLWENNYMTNNNGTIEPLPTFAFTSDDLLGNYSLLATTNYLDEITNTTASVENNYIMQLYEKPNELLLDLEAPSEVSTTENLTMSASVTDGIRSIDPDWINASLYDPANSMVCLEVVNGSCKYNIAMLRRDKGVYYRDFSISGSSLEGSWRWSVSVGKDSEVVKKEIFTKLVGGPFDLRNITIIDNGVPNLQISVIVENTGENGRDVTLVWNLTRTDNGARLDSSAETFYVAGKSEKTYTIFPTTNYIGEVKITMILYYGTEKAGAYRIFNTQEEITTTTVSPAPRRPTGAAVAVEKVPKIEIISYPKEVEIEKGWSGYAILGVNNSGDLELHNIEVKVEGIDDSWVEIPKKISSLSPGKLANFTIRFDIPKYVKSGNYEGNFTVTSDEAKDKKPFILRIFETREELIYYQIQTIENRLDKLENEIVQAERENKDVRKAKEILEDARSNIRIAQEYLDSKMYDKAKERIMVTKDLLNQAEMEIKTAKKYLFPFFGPLGVQYQLLTVTAILILALILIIYIVKKVKHISPKNIPSAAEIKKMILPKRNLKMLEDEKDKLEKTLKLLEEEYKQGIISEESYKELKESNERKLKKIYDEMRVEK